MAVFSFRAECPYFLQEYRCGFQIAADFVKIPLLCKNTVAI
jgi:hypothetical protein